VLSEGDHGSTDGRELELFYSYCGVWLLPVGCSVPGRLAVGTAGVERGDYSSRVVSEKLNDY